MKFLNLKQVGIHATLITMVLIIIVTACSHSPPSAYAVSKSENAYAKKITVNDRYVYQYEKLSPKFKQTKYKYKVKLLNYYDDDWSSDGANQPVEVKVTKADKKAKVYYKTDSICKAYTKKWKYTKSGKVTIYVYEGKTVHLQFQIRNGKSKKTYKLTFTRHLSVPGKNVKAICKEYGLYDMDVKHRVLTAYALVSQSIKYGEVSDRLKYHWQDSGIMYKRGTCAHYSIAFGRFMNELDIPTEFISSFEDPRGHGWNLVKINENWYHIDCTWADFLLSDQNFSSSSKKMFNIGNRYGRRNTPRCPNAFPKEEKEALLQEMYGNIDADPNYYIW
jgi:transglutaminase/protease-like cytokinesis protein 3